MRNFIRSLTCSLLALSAFSSATVKAEPQVTPIVNLSYQFVEDFVAYDDPIYCDFFGYCSSVTKINTIYTFINGYYQEYRTVYRPTEAGRNKCVKNTTWSPQDLVMQGNNVISATGRWAARCDNGEITRGTTSELPTELHAQAIGSESLTTNIIPFEGDIMVGDLKLTYNTQATLGPKAIDNVSQYFQIRERFAFGAKRSSLGGSRTLPAGLTCDKITVGQTKLRPLAILSVNDTNFQTTMRSQFGSATVFCERTARYWASDGYTLTPKFDGTLASNNIIQYRTSLGETSEK